MIIFAVLNIITSEMKFFTNDEGRIEFIQENDNWYNYGEYEIKKP